MKHEDSTPRDGEDQDGFVPRQIEPNRVEVNRRSDGERRVEDVPVDTDLRVQDRRTADDHALTSRERRNHAVARTVQVTDYLFYVLYGLLGLRFLLALLGASEQAGFVRFVNGVTDPFYAPFAGMISRPATGGDGYFDFPLLIAIAAYALLHLAVRGLIRLVASRRAATP
jgi:YggT family protein